MFIIATLLKFNTKFETGRRKPSSQVDRPAAQTCETAVQISCRSQQWPTRWPFRRRIVHYRATVQDAQLRRLSYARVQDMVEGTKGPLHKYSVRHMRLELEKICGSQRSALARRVSANIESPRKERGHAVSRSFYKTSEGKWSYCCCDVNFPSIYLLQTTASAHSTPPPTISIAAQNRCLGCQKTGPPGKVLKCKQCGFRVHIGIIGVQVDPSAVDSWVCELCENEETLEASVVSRTSAHGKNI